MTHQVPQTITPSEKESIYDEYLKCATELRTLMNRAKILLLKIDRYKIWREKGYSSIYEFAAKTAGLSEWQVNDALRILRKIEDKPALQAVAVEKGLSSVRPIAALATQENQEFWAEKAKTMSVNTLEAYAKIFEEKSSLQSKFGHMTKSQSEEPVLLRPDLARRLNQVKKRSDFDSLLEKFLDGIENQEKNEKPAPVETSSRHIPAKIKSFVLKKYGDLCAFPNCQKPYKILHHTQRFALEKVHDPNRLVPLCTAHERIAHHGLIDNEDDPPDRWQLREKADETNFKFFIDRQVAAFR